MHPWEKRGNLVLSDLVRSRRMELGLSANALGKKAGVSHTYIQNIENGDYKRLEMVSLMKLSQALDLPFEDVVGQIRTEAGMEPETEESEIGEEQGEGQPVPAGVELATTTEEREDTFMRAVFASLSTLEKSIPAMSGFLIMWAELPPSQRMAVADVIQAMYDRSKENKSGPVLPPMPRFEFQDVQVSDAPRILGNMLKYLPTGNDEQAD